MKRLTHIPPANQNGALSVIPLLVGTLCRRGQKSMDVVLATAILTLLVKQAYDLDLAQVLEATDRMLRDRQNNREMCVIHDAMYRLITDFREGKV